MRQPPSLLGRIILRLSLTTLGAVLCAYAVLWWQFQSITGTLRETSLIESARASARVVRPDGAGGLALDLPAAMRQAYAGSGGRHGFAVRDGRDGTLLFAAGAETGPLPAALGDDEDGSLYQYNPDGPGPAAYFGEAYRFAVAGRPLAVQVVQLSSDYQELIETILADFFEDGGWMAGPFLLLLLLVSILTVRGTLAPLRRLSDRLRAIGPANVGVRLPLAGVPREVLPLVDAVNDAFQRLDDGFRMEREFTADAAHELRTPLAVLMAHVDTLDDRAVAAALRSDIAVMAHLVEQLLRVARAEVLRVEPDAKVDLAAVAGEVCAYLAPMALRMGRRLEMQAPVGPVPVRADFDAVFHALRNLVDNALRHTPPGSTVTVGVDQRPPALGVRDRGPGVAAADREAVFRRFWRADRRVGGAGLGLSIVQRTMQAHGGTATCGDAAEGGAVFRMVFPEP